MKYFICTLDSSSATSHRGTECRRFPSAGNCLLAIPAEHTERIISASRVQAAIYETENDEAFLSIPALFKLNDRNTPHGLVLKPGLGNTKQQNIKTILLLPRIDVELEIPEEEIQRLPVALDEIFKYFRGIYFSSNMILVLDPGKLMESIE